MWVHQIDSYIKTNQDTYANKGDFCRDAIIRHFKLFKDCEFEGNNLAQILLAQQAIQEDQYQSEYQALIEKLDVRVEYYVQRGAKLEAVRVILSTMEYLHQMRDGYWKTECFKIIQAKFGLFLATFKGVSLQLFSDVIE
jgi:hypothetical protein